MTIPIGIDPASGKETCIWQGSSFKFVKAQNVRREIISILGPGENCLIAWDAPISFSHNSFSDRSVDRITRAWVKSEVEKGGFEKKSINALPFSGLSHWVISCQALGLPFGERIEELGFFDNQKFSNEIGSYVVEVHPAVSMGCMWLDAQLDIPFPVYKKSKESRKVIVQELAFPEACIENDDILDAYVAYRMADMFLKSEAGFVCNPNNGSYVLPYGDSFDQIAHLIGLLWVL